MNDDDYDDDVNDDDYDDDVNDDDDRRAVFLFRYMVTCICHDHNINVVVDDDNMCVLLFFH